MIRKLDEPTKKRLRVRAAVHGRSMEEEAREILRLALAKQESGPPNLATALRRRFEGVGMELPDLRRELLRRPPRFGK